jgi:hypothetical protein
MPSKRMKVKRRTEGVVPIDDQVFMLPWFLPKETYLAVRRILPNIHIAKMRYYFEDYGCMRCERRDVLYRTNGLCERLRLNIRLFHFSAATTLRILDDCRSRSCDHQHFAPAEAILTQEALSLFHWPYLFL